MWYKEKYRFVKENPYCKEILNGLGLIICSEWNDSFVKIIHDNNIMHLFLNYSLGWKCPDYTFLELIQSIETLDIIDIHSNGIKSVEHQSDLLTLSLNMPNANDVDYRVFHNLKDVFCYGGKPDSSLFSCKSIERLYVDNLNIGDKHGISNLQNLKNLTVANSNITSLSFVKNLILLECLAILNCKKLQSFAEISSLNNLKRLEIRGIKGLSDIGFLSNLCNMEIVIIETDALNSIRPLENLKKIKALALFGKKFIIEDKDLSPIDKLKQLSMLDIPNRRCYPVRINNHWDWKDFGIQRKNWLTKK